MNLDSMTSTERQAVVDRFYWYHSLQFPDGVASRGVVDPTAALPRYGFPGLQGKSVLDVGAGDGYFSFAFEGYGARRVLAVDIDRWTSLEALDTPPRTRGRRLRKFAPAAGQEAVWHERRRVACELGFPTANPFHLAHRLKSSRVDFRYLSVYDLADLHETFDLVFLGTVTTVLEDLPAAFAAVRAVTANQAVIACADLLDFRPRQGWRRVAYHAIRSLTTIARLEDEFPQVRERPVALYTANDGGSVWRPSAECIRQMVLSAGFRDVDVYSRFSLENLAHGTRMHHVIFHAFV